MWGTSARILLVLALAAGHVHRDAQCGPRNGYRCPPSAPCCSKWGFCGLAEHCAPGICVAGCPGGVVANSGGVNTGGAHAGGANTGGANTGGAKSPATAAIVDERAPVAFEAFASVFGADVHLGCADPSHAALTFDDGVDAKLTPRLLDTLAAKNATAAFFVLGNTLDYWHDAARTRTNDACLANRAVLQRMHAAGHEVGVHSFDHARLPPLGDAQLRFQAEHTAALVRGAIGRTPRLFRAPEGQLSVRVVRALRALGLAVVHWSHDTCDWRYHTWHPEYLVKSVHDAVPKAPAPGRGPILLQHDNIRETVEQQARIIDALRAKGYAIVPLSVCIGEAPYAPENRTDAPPVPGGVHTQSDAAVEDPARPCTALDVLTLAWCSCFGGPRPWCEPRCT